MEWMLAGLPRRVHSARCNLCILDIDLRVHSKEFCKKRDLTVNDIIAV